MKLNRSKIAYRLAAGFGLILILMIGIAVIADEVSRRALSSLDQNIERTNNKSTHASAMRRALIQQGIIVRSLGDSDDMEEINRELLKMVTAQAVYQSHEEQLISLGLNTEEEFIIEGMRSYAKEVEPAMQRFKELVTAFSASQAVRVFTTQAAPVHEKWLSALDRLVDQQNWQMQENLASIGITRHQARLSMFSICLASIGLALLIGFLLTRSITTSMNQLIDFSREVASGNLSARAPHEGTDEFATLADAMNQMAQSLADAQSLLLATAHKAGMAEIASNVLHNVGNVLNSVNVSVSQLETGIETSRIENVVRTARLMETHAATLGEYITQDARGKLIPGYLKELGQILEAERSALRSELSALGKNVDHIKAVIATQQSFATSQRIVQQVRLAEVIDDALRINADALARHRIAVEKRIDDLPLLLLDRNRLMQILINFISNAKQAMNGLADQAPRIVIGAGFVEGRELRISVADNGEGIPEENLKQIFSHGFTTRKDGHGFGLHSCAIAAREMGGSIAVHSDGIGRGTIFTLSLPVATTEPAE